MLTVTQLSRSEEDSIRWSDLLSISKNANYMASMPYVYSKELYGRVTTTFIFSKDNTDIAGSHFSLKKLPLNLVTISDMNSGIVFKNDPDMETYQFIMDHYIKWAKLNNASLARINFWLPKIIKDKLITGTAEIERDLIAREFLKICEPKHSYWIDLLDKEEDILKKMHPQTRYRIRQGIKSEIETIIYDSIDNEAIDKFWFQYKNIGERKGFNMYSERKFKNEIYTLINSGLANLYIEKFGDVIVNFSLASNFGIAYYMHGAINPEFKKLKGCPSPGQLAQWEMITKVKALGAIKYDMGFCPGPTPIPGHPKYSIWRFKYDFGGVPVEFLPVYGKIIKPLRGRLFLLLSKFL